MKKITHVILGVLSVVLSRAIFFLFNDPEGPNLLIVMALAAMIYAVCVAVHVLLCSGKGETLE